MLYLALINHPNKHQNYSESPFPVRTQAGTDIKEKHKRKPQKRTYLRFCIGHCSPLLIRHYTPLRIVRWLQAYPKFESFEVP